MYQSEGGIFAGNLLLDALDANGAQTGERDVGETSNFTVEAMKITQKQRTGHRLENFGNTIDSVNLSKTQALKFTLGDINKKNLALAMFGSDSVVNVSTGSVTDEAVVARLDKEVKLSKMKIKSTPAVVVTNDAGTTTYVENTDYEIDYTYGTIKALSTGAITEAQALKVDFSYDAYTGYNVKAATQTKIDCFLRLKGKNVRTGKPVMVIVHKASLTPSGNIDWITDDFAKLEFAGDIQAVGSDTWEAIALD